MNKIGFIGAGKMASAIIGGILSGNLFESGQVIASEYDAKSAADAEQRLGIKVYTDNSEVVKNSDVIVLCVKPFILKDVLREIKPFMSVDKVAISIVAGVSSGTIEQELGVDVSVIRVMPNTPALVCEGMSVLARGGFTKDVDLLLAKNIFQSVGQVVEVEENSIDSVTGISGSGPAYFYYVMEQMAQGGVTLGLDYDVAIKLAAQTAIGSAQMVLQRDIPVATLIQNVATKGGCTEVGLQVLVQEGVDRILERVVVETAKKAKQLGA